MQNSSGTTLRAAVATDLPMLYRLELQYLRDLEPAAVDGWMRALDRNLELWTQNLSRATVAEVEGIAAGIALWMRDPDGGATLVTIHVLPGFRRRGLAALLLESFVTVARAAGRTPIRLGVHVSNPARALYEKNGFAAVGTKGDYLLYERR